jgi:hypothetical protein
MQFRWIAFIALWTILIGPILGVPVSVGSRTSTSPLKAVAPGPTSAVPR